LFVLVVACAALIGGGGGGDTTATSESDDKGQEQKETASKQKQKEQEITVSMGEAVAAGDVTWRVTDARRTNQLTQQGVSQRFAKTEQGDFVIVDFDFTNNGSDAITLDNESLALVDSEGRESKPSSGSSFYVPEDRRIFLERVNPGVTKQGEAIFEVAPGTSGFQLQVGDANMFTNENGYVDLGF